MEETLDYAHKLDQMDDIVRRWCPEGIFSSTAFSKKKKSILELRQEMLDVFGYFFKNYILISIYNVKA